VKILVLYDLPLTESSPNDPRYVTSTTLSQKTSAAAAAAVKIF
jgi:hypothetical protein